MRPQRLVQAAERVVQSPFSRGWRAAARRLEQVDVRAALGELARAPEQAELVLIAALHVAAIRDAEAARRLAASVPRAVAQRLPRSTAAYLRTALAAGRCWAALAALHGDSEAMARVRHQTWSACFGQSLLRALELERVIRDHDVLVVGETGTGKETVAGAIQAGTPGDASGAPAPSAALNAAAIPDALVESELFGHVRGAFTGAIGDRPGRVRSAAGGCLFLDEVGDLPPTAQAKLLRVMETNRVSPVGSDREHDADVRYVAATHQDLGAMVDSGAFRRDLQQRLAGMVIVIPPLRDRPEDIASIGMAFVAEQVPGDHRHIARFLASDEARRYAWPGNVRELANALRNLLLGLAPGIGAEAGPRDTAPGRQSLEIPDARIAAGTATLEEATDWYVARVLAAHGGNFAAAGRALGVDRSTVKRRAQPAARQA